MKKILAMLMAMAMVLSLAACSGGDGGSASSAGSASASQSGDASGSQEGGNLVGVAMPTKDLQRWNQDGENMKAQLEAAGYTVDLQYAANDIPTQVSQIENMIANGCEVLVIASIDGEALGTALDQAKAKNIPVISYDRLIMNSDAVTYYATFDNWNVGVKQGEYIVEALDLANAGDKTYNIEFITGDPGDNNINFFFDGAISVLQPYIDAGTLVCPSGQTEKQTVATANWASDAAQSRFENILAGTQSMSVFKDTRTLAEKTVEMVDALMKGTEPTINDTETYDNGTGVIPSYLCEPVVCTIDNYKELLVDSGYYTEAELAG